MTTQTIILGNAEISRHISTARTQWASGSQARFELGEIFSKLRESIEKYNKDDEKGISYNEAVRLTGVPRGTAEHYRHMYEVCKENDIPNDAFTILAEAGFNLATELRKPNKNDPGATVAGVLTDNPNLRSVEYLLGLSQKETVDLIASLQEGYGKIDNESKDSIQSLQAEIAHKSQIAQKSTDSDYKQFLLGQIDDLTTTVRNKMLWVLRNIAQTFAPLLGKDEEWVESYLKQYKQEGEVTVLVEQAFTEAVKFAQSATFLTGTPHRKPAGSAKKSTSHTAKKA